MTLNTKPAAPIGLSEEEAALVRQSSQTITGFARDEEPLRVTLTRENGLSDEMTVRGGALHLVAHVLEEMAEGHPLTLIPLRAELTTHQAAGILRVSRPYLIKLSDTGKLLCRKVGT